MSEAEQSAAHTSEPVAMDKMLEHLKRIPIFASLKQEELHCFDNAVRVNLAPGEKVITQGERCSSFWILLEGGVSVYQQQADGSRLSFGAGTAPETFGEVPLLAGLPSAASIDITQPSTLIRLDEDAFWQLMVTCPDVRKAILGNMAQRVQKLQSLTLQREKLASLGTLAAGLMHELNNPGSAAKRAASQLRENLYRLQQLSWKFSRIALTDTQWVCMVELQKQAMESPKPQMLNSLEQSDREEALAEWMEANGVENAWKLAPTLVSIGMGERELVCARGEYEGALFSDALNWLEALVSSMQMVSIIEESVARVTDLVHAVKKYSYEDKGRQHALDVNDSLYSTLVIMAHKFRAKEIRVVKNLAADLPLLETQGTGLNQVWTNLLDNAVDAVAAKGTVKLSTWVEANDLCVSIADNGVGISAESQPHIFEPFYTTKPVGVGTGLGLDIAHRIVVGQYGGEIRFKTSSEGTEFIVRLPLKPSSDATS